MLGLARVRSALAKAADNLVGNRSQGTTSPIFGSMSALPLAAKPRHLPVWVGRQRPRSETKLPQTYVGKSLRGLEWAITYARLTPTVFDPSGSHSVKRKRRATWRAIRRDLPRMSGRQWRKMRQQLFHSAKAA